MVVSGVAKIFVGEIVEKAREIQAERGEQGPLRPNHLREAHRQYYLRRERPGYYPPGTNTGFPRCGQAQAHVLTQPSIGTIEIVFDHCISISAFLESCQWQAVLLSHST